jgi:hypothetical protein
MDTEHAAHLLRHMMFLLIFLPIVIVAGVTLTLSTIAMIRMIVHRAKVRHAEQQAWRETHDENGELLPPVSEGICQQCGRYFRRIYYLPDGSRICEECYKPADENNSARRKSFSAAFPRSTSVNHAGGKDSPRAEL